jgi:hypothetical protein
MAEVRTRSSKEIESIHGGNGRDSSAAIGSKKNEESFGENLGVT